MYTQIPNSPPSPTSWQIKIQKNGMDLADLQLKEMLLALDLVAGWQLDKVKEQPIWSTWPENTVLRLMDRHFRNEDVPISGFDPDFMRIKLKSYCDTPDCQSCEVDYHSRTFYELEWFDKGCNLTQYVGFLDDWDIPENTIPTLRRRSVCHENDECETATLKVRRGSSYFIYDFGADLCCFGYIIQFLPSSNPLGPTYYREHHCTRERYGFPELHVAVIPIPSSNSPQSTTLKIDIFTEEGKRVCQQVLLDMGRHWIGETVEYLALYVRDW